MTHVECAILGYNGCKNCVLYKEEEKTSCWKWAEAHPEELELLVEKSKLEFKINKKDNVICDQCCAVTPINPYNSFYDEYMGKNVVHCRKCGILLEIDS